MHQFEAYLRFPTYETKVSMWGANDKEVRKILNKRYPYGEILWIKKL